jgi:hypothetical protein
MRFATLLIAVSLSLAACASQRPVSPSESLGDTGTAQDNVENRAIEQRGG